MLPPPLAEVDLDAPLLVLDEELDDDLALVLALALVFALALPLALA